MSVKHEALAEAFSNSKRGKQKADQYFSRAVGKAMEALEILKKTNKALSLQTLSNRLGIAKTSVFRLLHTLERSGYVVRNEAGLYTLSPDARSMVPAHFVTHLLAVATPGMKNLIREFRETVSVALLFDNHIEVVAALESPQIIRMANTVGRILPPHASSLGKSIAAFQSEERREKLLRSYGIYRYTPNTITDERELREEFDQIRSQGFAIDNEESVSGGCCAGIPLIVDGSAACGAISVSMPASRFPDKPARAGLLSALRDTAEEIKSRLGRGNG